MASASNYGSIPTATALGYGDGRPSAKVLGPTNASKIAAVGAEDGETFDVTHAHADVGMAPGSARNDSIAARFFAPLRLTQG
jgi:hypothetical protein